MLLHFETTALQSQIFHFWLLLKISERIGEMSKLLFLLLATLVLVLDFQYVTPFRN